MKMSNDIVGRLSPEREEFTVIDGERFLSAKFTSNKYEYKIVGSEYILRDIEGKVRLSGCIQGFMNKDNIKENVIYILKVDPAEESAEEIVMFQLGGVIELKRELKVANGICSNILPFTISYGNSNKEKQYVNCVVYNKDARMLQNVSEGKVVSGEGYVKYYNGNLEFVFTKNIDYRDRLVGTEEVMNNG